MLCTTSGRYNECDSYGDALGDVSQSAVSDWLGRQVISLTILAECFRCFDMEHHDD
jgi:hypothetical protein|eukprot:COSAG02_NODE_1861_length_10613_cov_3.797033_15_plen_56_part_00